MMTTGYTIAVDSGGTFCDCVVLDAGGRITRAKAPSTPPNFEEGVMQAITEAARRLGMTLRDLLAETAMFAHGTTVATNVLLTRSGARVALLTTRGHEDAILIGRTMQKVAGLTESEIINVARLSKADPLVPRSRIFGVDERVDRRGQVVVPLHLDRHQAVLDRLRGEDVEAIAVCFLWSFLYPEHERRVREWLLADGGSLGEPGSRDAGDGHRWFVTISSDLVPLIREYERTSTTVLNAYLTPAVGRYLQRMGDLLRQEGHEGAIAVMHSAGGVSSIEEARSRAVTLLSSGPAGGVLGAQALAARLGFGRVISTDVGGTSFDVGIIADGAVSYAESPVFAKYPVALPVVDVASIGAGGGSIAWVEPETGVLKVGPQSAGARPGPACYGSGGTDPTVTDANLVLGRLNPGYFLGGRLPLHPEAAREAIRTRVADPLGMGLEAAAAAIIEIVDAQMADLIRKVTVERGYDPARFVVFGYGGAAGLHVGAYAATLGCRHVVIPQTAAVFSAFGIAASDAKRVVEVSDPSRAPFDLTHWRRRFRELEAEATRQMRAERLPIDHLVLRRFAHLQFRGQVHAVRVPIDDEDLAASDGGERIIGRFTALYEAKYGRGTAYRKAGVELVTFAVEAEARLPKPLLEDLPAGDPDPQAAVKDRRPVYVHESRAFEPVPVFAAERLRPGHRMAGPALVEAEDMTIFVHPGQTLWVDGMTNFRIEIPHGRG
ncbi:MAG: hydantoinase/oxoprolinase family protein [Armatimonadota bacterium]|nr:hydantoinase/oxoprolinase family protein [Armatimonadota bacterium]